jgi:hypothetical protein
MQKVPKDKIISIISGLMGVAQSCEHQALCIEAETTGEEASLEDGTLVSGITDMWDSNDLDNWTSMEASVKDAIDCLQKILSE